MPDHHEYCTGGFDPDDIVITGISGRFPECNNIGELKEALLNAKNILIPKTERFEKGAADLPFSSTGTINNIDKFDVEFFGYSVTGANCADPVQRMLLEVSYEAMADAGYEPMTDFRGANIGVYTAVSNEDGKEIMFEVNEYNPSFAPGYLRCMLANRVSHVFDFHGPSFTVDTACSSSFVALWSAYNDIREGRVDAALVNAGQLCLSPFTHMFYFGSGIVSSTSESNPFDARANGIVRTEAITAMFLQKASVARRAYASILNMKHASTGYVPEGVYVPSFKEEVRLFQDVLRETNLSINDIQFIEAHGTGTQVGDPIEVRALEAVFCKGRDKPLYIGSVKSNLGHAEAAAGESGAIKAILAFETGLIAPNEGFQSPNPNIESLMNGSIKVLTEAIPLEAEYIPVNSFGFGGSIVHAILKKNPIEYPKDPEPKDLPRLVLFSATTEDAILFMFEYIENHPELRAEFFALLNKLSFAPVMLKPYRGYALFQNQRPATQIKSALREKKREVWFVMTGMGCQWSGMGLEMMQIKVFADSMKKSAAVLKPLGVDLFELLKKDSKNLMTDRSITPAFVAISAIQIALVDVLKALEIEPDGIIGHSTGEIICAYADGCATAEQTIRSAYWRGRCVEAAGLAVGAMAAVGLTWEEAIRRCPEGVYPACHNSEDSVTISGLKEPVEKFVAELQKENIFARVVNAYGYAFHSEYVWPASKSLKKSLLELFPNPKPRTERWVSTSYPEGEWNTEGCRVAGAEYFVHNLMSVVRFYDVLERIPSDALTIEIGPHFLLQSILKRSIGSDAIFIGLMKRNDENNIGFFLESIGKLYLEGFNPKVENLYRPVKFPVPRATPMICDLIKWDHTQSLETPVWKPSTSSFSHRFQIKTSDAYLLDHFIDGRSLFPATGYVYLAWQALAKKLERCYDEFNVVIEDFKIHRATILSPTTFTFQVTILDISGTFEIMEENTLVASGRVYMEKNLVFCEPAPQVDRDSSTFVSGEDLYNELRIRGYQYGPHFRKLVETSLNGKEGFVEWDNNWITFMDSLLLFYMFSGDMASSFLLPTGALCFKIAPDVLKRGVEESLSKNLPGLPVNFYKESRICRTVGLEIRSLEVDAAPQHAKSDNCIFEEYKFLPYVHKYLPPSNCTNLEKYMLACNKVIDSLQGNAKPDPRHGKFNMKSKIDFDIDSYLEEASDNYQILLTLQEMSTFKISTDKQRCRELYNNYIQNVGKDFANSLLLNDYSLRYMFDIISENSFRKLSILEIKESFPTILPTIVEVVEKYSMLKFKSKLLASNSIDEDEKNRLSDLNIGFCSHDSISSVAEEGSQGVVLSSITTSTKEEARRHLQLLSYFVDQKGFILLLHKSNILPPESLLASLSGESISVISNTVLESWFEEENLMVVSRLFDELGGNLYLLRRTAVPVDSNIIQVSEDGKWLDDLKSTVCESSKTSWVVSYGSPSSGIIGMINCLRHEPGGDRIRCVFIPEKNKEKKTPPNFSFEDRFFQDVLKKDLVMNVYKEGVWGSFRHFRIEKELQHVDVDYSYVNIKKYGDLSSLTWMESGLSYKEPDDKRLVHVYYSALNFRDVMLATGKISTETAKVIQMEARIKGGKTAYHKHSKTEEFGGIPDIDDCVLGLEFSGRTKYGERVAGMCGSRGLSTATEMYPEGYFLVPDEWSLEEAATVPVVYLTCYYSLIMRAGLQPGESILIHSGTGGIGQAAINIANSMNCEIYTTVGTERKRNFLMKNFPFIKSENIGCSRNTTFENMIMKRTKGRGVDVVLNSLADDKFLATIRCVASHGRFIEIGKYDLAMDHKIGLKFLLRNISFHGVFLDQLIKDFRLPTVKRLMEIFKEGVRNGVVKPLNRTVFQYHEVEKAFRYMGSGTHTGKVLIKIRDEENQRFSVPMLLRRPATPITYFYPHKVYVIIGGLGGFGIELSKWLLSKGAKNLVLTTRYGARTPYHQLCLKRWKDEGLNVFESKMDVSNKDEAAQLLKEVSEIGPVGGIFNSAVVLHDAFLENSNWEDFKEVCAPKADATKNLDVLSRCLCPELDHFVCFSSISCGRGNAGQMNYGYANSVMERVCEQRRADGYPGLAIQWGIIGEVGVVHRHMGDDAMIAGVGAQKVKSCLEMLDVACQLKRPVVCSYVIKDSSGKQGDRGDVLQQLARIFGFKDPSEFNFMRSFGEMGVDSMIGIEVKHLLETTCDVTLTMQEIQELKIGDVKALLEKMESQKSESSSNTLVSTVSCTSLPTSGIHTQAVERLNEEQNGVPVFIIDIEDANVSLLRKLSSNIRQPVYGLFISKEAPITDLKSLATWFLEKITEITRNTAVHIIALSSASIVAFEIALQIQKSEKKGPVTLTVLNGSSSLVKIPNKEKLSDVDILCEFVENYIPLSRKRIQEQLSTATTMEQQIRSVVELFSNSSKEKVDKSALTGMITSRMKKAQLLEAYEPKDKLCRDILIIEDSSKMLANDIAEVKMTLSEICSGKINIQRVPDISPFNEDSIQRLIPTLKSVL